MASDTLLQTVGLVLIVAAVTLVLALEAPVGKRLVFGAAYEELEFERSLMEARLPFIEAAATRDPSVVEKARWRASLPVDPPSFEWAALADRIGAADEEWAARPPLPAEEPARWDLANARSSHRRAAGGRARRA